MQILYGNSDSISTDMGMEAKRQVMNLKQFTSLITIISVANNSSTPIEFSRNPYFIRDRMVVTIKHGDHKSFYSFEKLVKDMPMLMARCYMIHHGYARKPLKIRIY